MEHFKIPFQRKQNTIDELQAETKKLAEKNTVSKLTFYPVQLTDWYWEEHLTLFHQQKSQCCTSYVR